MKVLMQLKNLTPGDTHDDQCKCKICRNLSKIMDIKIVDVNADKQTISFIYENPKTVAIVIDELRRIGCPIKYTIKTSKANLFKRIDQQTI